MHARRIGTPLPLWDCGTFRSRSCFCGRSRVCAGAAGRSQFEAAKAAYDAISDSGRKAVQEALIWSGDYSGIVDGSFGRRTYDAIVGFEKQYKLKADGIIDAKEREALDAAAQKARQAVQFRKFTDPRNGLQIGMPGRGSRQDDGHQDRDAACQRRRQRVPGDPVVHRSGRKSRRPLREDHRGERRPQGHLQVAAGRLLRGQRRGPGPPVLHARRQGTAGPASLAFTYRANRKAELDRVTIAMANAFVPFPETHKPHEVVDSAARCASSAAASRWRRGAC